MKKLTLALLLFSAAVLNAQGKNARLDLLNGVSIEGNITEILQYQVTAFVKGKIKFFKADSLAGFRFEGNEYLSLKTQSMEHCEFAYKLKTLDEFELYGWVENFDISTQGTLLEEHTNVYKYIKRQKDERTRVFEYSKDGVEQMPFLNCPTMMQQLLKRYSTSEDLLDILNTYERDCGIEMRNK